MKQKVKFMTVVWGSRYIDDFISISLPSYLSPGNIQAFDENFDLEFVFLTSSKDIEYLKSINIINQISKKYRIKYVQIDDLITTGQYGVTLTGAYTRGIISYGEEMLDIYFIFMNSDFVLANNSLSYLIQYIKNGNSVIVAPSLRVVAEDSLDLFKEHMIDNVLHISKEEMLNIVLNNLHPTVMAKTVNQTYCHMVNQNQFYWRIDDNTLLARFFLIFMLCIKPEKLFSGADSYCDYGFIPAMCPSNDIIVIQDSDDFLMVELQERYAECDLIAQGEANIKKIARNLSQWTTKTHRKISDYNIIFHKNELPENINQFYLASSDYLSNINNRLKKPIPYKHHRYWESGVYYWKYLRIQNNKGTNAREIVIKQSSKIKHLFSYLVTYFMPKIIGVKPKYYIYHPEWIDYIFLIREFNKANSVATKRLLVINANDKDIFFKNEETGKDRFTNIEHFLSEEYNHEYFIKHNITHNVIYFTYNELTNLEDIFLKISTILSKNIKYTLIIHNMYGNLSRYQTITTDIDMYIQKYLLSSYCDIELDYVGGFLKNILHTLLMKCGKLGIKYGLISMVLVAPAFILLNLLIIINNIFSQDRKSQRNLSSISIVSVNIN